MNQLFPYAGSSKKYAKLIKEMILREGYETYAEPMVGSGAVYFELAPAKAILGDVEWLHGNLYRCIKDDIEPLIYEVERIPPTEEWFTDAQVHIYELGDRWNVAAAWYAMLILCYNGVVQKKDDRPYLTWGDRYLTWKKRLPTYTQRLRVASVMLQSAEIYTVSYELLPEADMAFFDPPWFDSKENYGVEFSHTDLAEYLKFYRGNWILTINDTEQAREVYTPIAEWMKELQPYYSVAPVGKGRFKRTELLFTNFKPQMFGG